MKSKEKKKPISKNKKATKNVKRPNACIPIVEELKDIILQLSGASRVDMNVNIAALRLKFIVRLIEESMEGND